MKVLVLGGTRFIGRRVVADLVARGDEVLVAHRGDTEPAGLPPARHLHVDRPAFATVADEIARFAPDAVIDCYAMSRSDVDSVLPYLPDTQLVLLSSMDVYQAFAYVVGDQGEGEPVPVPETGPLRADRYLYRGRGARPDDYEKLDVEPSYVERGGTVLRLAMIYGEHDHQRREEFILRRLRAGRRRIPIGAGTWLWTRAYVGDVSAAVLACLGNPAVRGETLNIGEPAVRSIRGWAADIIATAGRIAGADFGSAELVTVRDVVLAEDLWLTKSIDQHVLVDCGKAVRLLDWRPDPVAGLERSVAWHLEHPPPDASADFSADDAALATVEN
jgi:nucleoside-diphosphate-sugar epimerase